jgi:SAM-dependent methyltransferase
MVKLVWTTPKYARVGEYLIPCSENLMDQSNQVSGIMRESKSRLLIRRASWPLTRFEYDLFVDGFIEWTVGKWIRDCISPDSTFLEIGCGDMRLSRYLPLGLTYNAFDLALSEFHLLKTLRRRPDANVALASATDIPVSDNSVSLMVSTECFEEIPDIDLALDELHRISKPGARMICSIPNGFCYKYKRKGSNRRNFHRWSFTGFEKLANKHDFTLVKGLMRGFWIPLPPKYVRTSYQMPLTSPREELNTNFFYIFEVRK